MGDDLGSFHKISDFFQVEKQDINLYSPLTLAFIGDGVFDCIVRSIIVGRGNKPNNVLHSINSSIVKATTQANMIMAVFEDLSEEEKSVYKRGKNAKTSTGAKNASKNDYHKATGFEALLGYLYLLGREDRMLGIIKMGLEKTGQTL